ncbi:MAG: DUF4395 domain-containing protein [Chloroflexi bacterium]|nr:DUF4395 domain-containing protein [Chloroflexota bacterium]
MDRTALRFNQGSIIALIVAGYLFDSAIPVAFTAAVLLVGTIWPAGGLFKQLYVQALRPVGLLRPDRTAEDPAPHLFAQGVGAVCLVMATGLFATGLLDAAWSLAGLVAALAGINLVFGFCVGCFLYFQLARLGVVRGAPQAS